MVQMSAKEKNLGVVAVCDLWNKNRERTAQRCNEMFNTKVVHFQYFEDLLNMPELDAVMIATGDFQHARIMAEVVKAGKDCYCEKPMTQEVDVAKMASEVVLASKQVVQMGSQWVSDPIQIKVRDIVRSGKLGQITKIEQVWNDNGHAGTIRMTPISKKEAVKSGKAEIVTTEEYGNKLLPTGLSNDSKYHMDNWVDCMRTGNQKTNGHIHTGFWHSTGVVMATRSYREGKKLYWDRKKEEISEQPVD